jgi:hypothetical protein
MNGFAALPKRSGIPHLTEFGAFAGSSTRSRIRSRREAKRFGEEGFQTDFGSNIRSRKLVLATALEVLRDGAYDRRLAWRQNLMPSRADWVQIAAGR